MRPLIVIMLLVLSCGSAYAEWIEVSANKIAGVTAYADPDTIRRKGDLVKMWSLFDLRTTQTGGATRTHLSRRSKHMTVHKIVVGRLRLRSSLAIWDTVRRFLAL